MFENGNTGLEQQCRTVTATFIDMRSSVCTKASSCDRCSVRRAESLCKRQAYLLYRLYSLNTYLHTLFRTWNYFLTLKCGGEGEFETCWVFEHSSGISVRMDNALQEHRHVRDFVCCQLFQRSLQGPAEKHNYCTSHDPVLFLFFLYAHVGSHELKFLSCSNSHFNQKIQL